MIQRSPAENYFKYLVLHPALYDDAYIAQVAKVLSLDIVTKNYLPWLRDRVRAPVPFYPEDPNHFCSYSFLVNEGLLQVFQPNDDMKMVYDILYKPRARELVETLILSGAPERAIAHALEVRVKMRVSPRSIRFFKYYFWNIDLFSSLEMRTYLELRHQGAFAETDSDTQAHYVAIRRLRHSDPRMVAAKLPQSPVSAMIAQLEMGVLPRKIDLGLVVEETMAAAVIRARQAVDMNTPQGAQMAQSLSVVADIMNRIKETVVKPEEKLREDLQRISIATTPNRVPTLGQLTDGQHTTNLHPDPKPDEADIVVEGQSADDEGTGNEDPTT